MNITEEHLLENKDARNVCIDHIDVLEKVGQLITLPNGYSSLKQVALYFDANVKTIENYWNSPKMKELKQEIVEDGAKVFAKDEILLTLPSKVKTKRGGFDILDENGEVIATGSNQKGVVLLPKRAILRIGMTLRENKVAKELRTRLLDIIHDAEHKTDIVDKVFQEIRTEQEIADEMSQAILQGDFAKLSLLQTELIDLKNKRIVKLENNYDLLANNYTSFEDFKRVANACVRAITSSSGVPIEKVWSAYYSFLFDKEGINVSVRYKNEIERLQNERIELGKKPYSESTLKSKVNRLRTIKPKEYEKCLNALKGLAVKYDVDLEKVVKLELND